MVTDPHDREQTSRVPTRAGVPPPRADLAPAARRLAPTMSVTDERTGEPQSSPDDQGFAAFGPGRDLRDALQGAFGRGAAEREAPPVSEPASFPPVDDDENEETLGTSRT